MIGSTSEASFFNEGENYDKETKKISKLDIVLTALIIASVHLMIACAIAGLIVLLFCK